MITVMRKHHKILMIVITFLVCISFAWYWNKTDFSQMGRANVGQIYGQPVSDVDLLRGKRLFELARQLGMRDLLIDLTIGARTENEASERFAWSLMVLRHEAEKLGIKPTTSEIADAVKALPVFAGPQGFDPKRYTMIADQALAPNGFTEAQIEELAADQISLDRVKSLLDAGVNLPEKELRTGYEKAYGKLDVAVVRLHKSDLGQPAQVTDEDVKKQYEQAKSQFKTEEKRKISFVRFGLTDEQKKLTGKARIDELQKLADEANNFTDALQAKGSDFNQVAAKFHLTPHETQEFTSTKPPPQLSGSAQVAQAAFGLTKESPNSDAIQGEDGFYIEHLVNVEPSRPLTLEEARPKIVQTLQQERERQALALKGGEIARKLRSAIESGKSPNDAAAAAGVKLEKLAPFALVETPPGTSPTPTPPNKSEPADMQSIRQVVSQLEPGKVGDYVSTPEGGIVVVLEKREAPTQQQFAAARGALEKTAMENKGAVVFYEWLRDRRHAAGVPEPSEATQPGTPG